ncbi:MAG: hypothetical protein AVDCRST_MAG65-25 [uncultured Solirubrobacteraceae bacterium]|uniref:Uncharacterized protein n=1 Tax=uncultured Solirubrobacteraceae bacterium TaxID=1162706 RepID=A0A6J4R8U2_9ACTN|nr:MAG: hypothetical protein AVDCRST_MAG65-25 [uncultured Solirubrobacteraceae bacterium]
MSSPQSDRDNMMRANGLRLLLIGGIGALVGIIVMFLAPGRGAGVAIAWVATVPTLAGIALLVAYWVARRAGQDKPFA